MSRLPRLNIADGVYHVTQRGLERRDIVLNDKDRHDWWRLFDCQATRCGWRVFAYALLDIRESEPGRPAVGTGGFFKRWD